MTLVEKTAPEQSDAVAFEFTLAHAPEKVWRALTNPALLSEWLLPVEELQLTPGAPFTFRAPPQPGWDGVVNCRMLKVDPYRTLTWAWTTGDLDTEVTFTLTPTESGTTMSLVHSGFKADQKRNFNGARYGLKMMGEKLITLLDEMDT